MRFITALIASLSLMASTASAASLNQLLSSSYIADMATYDVNTNTQLQSWRQFQQVTRDNNMMQTTIMAKQWQMNPFNQTITYEQAQLSGTGGSALDGFIATYDASSYAPSLTGPGRVWTSCDYNMMVNRQPNYCSEIVEVPSRNYTCGMAMDRTCTMTQVACRKNNVIMPSVYYMLDIKSGEVVQQMDSVNATQVTYWSNINAAPTAGQFGDVVLLPARSSCPNNNEHFPATFGTAPVAPGATSTPTQGAGTPTNMPTMSSTGAGSSSRSSTGVYVYNAASSLPSLSALLAILPVIMTAALKL